MLLLYFWQRRRSRAYPNENKMRISMTCILRSIKCCKKNKSVRFFSNIYSLNEQQDARYLQFVCRLNLDCAENGSGIANWICEETKSLPTDKYSSRNSKLSTVG